MLARLRILQAGLSMALLYNDSGEKDLRPNLISAMNLYSEVGRVLLLLQERRVSLAGLCHILREITGRHLLLASISTQGSSFSQESTFGALIRSELNFAN